MPRYDISRSVLETAGIVQQLIDVGIDETDPDFHELVEAECDGLEKGRRFGWKALETEAMIEMLDKRIAQLQQRKSALKARSFRLRQTLLWMMDTMGIRKLPAPEFTASVRIPKAGTLTVQVEAKDLPDRFVRITREVNKTAINQAADAGEDLTGIAVRGNPQPILTITQG